MKAKLARAGAAALLILVMAVTPLSAFLSGGQFETWWPGDRFDAPVRVLLDDHTGFVSGVSLAPTPAGVHEAVANPGADRRSLTVTVDGSSCDLADSTRA